MAREPVFHIQLRQFPHSARMYNLSRAELEERFTGPWARGREVVMDERKWAPDKARLSVYESRPLRADEIAIGRGWGNVERQGSDVTERELERMRPEPKPGGTPEALAAMKDELVAVCGVAPIPVSRALSLARIARPGARASERLAVAEQAVWELLHERRADLVRSSGTEPVDPGDWEQVLLSWSTWAQEPPTVLLAAAAAADMNRGR
jgi:hypothetical protein